VHTAIIGADFLSKFQLLIDLKIQRLIDSISGLSTPACLAQAKHISVSTVKSMSKFQKLLSEFVDVTKPSIKAATQHDIETNGIPLADRPRRLSGEKLVTGMWILSKTKFNCHTGLLPNRPYTRLHGTTARKEDFFNPRFG